MSKFHLVVVLLGIATIAWIMGCGGGGHHDNVTIDRAVQDYIHASTQSEITAALVEIDNAIGVNNPANANSTFAIDADFRDWLGAQCLSDRHEGFPATIADVLADWRADPDSRFATDTTTFLADLQVAIATANASPVKPESALPILIEKLAKAENPGSLGIIETTRCDTMLARVLSMWSIEHFGLASPAPAPGSQTRESVECKACKDAELVKCNDAYNQKLTNLAATAKAAETNARKALQAGLITQNEFLQQAAAAREAFNNGKKAAQNALTACKKDIPNKCKKECHQQS